MTFKTGDFIRRKMLPGLKLHVIGMNSAGLVVYEDALAPRSIMYGCTEDFEIWTEPVKFDVTGYVRVYRQPDGTFRRGYRVCDTREESENDPGLGSIGEFIGVCELKGTFRA